MTQTRAIEAVRVSFAYAEGTQALQDVDLQVESGDFVALLASNGSGKTTLLKVLVGLLKPQRGTLCVFGAEIGKLPPSELYRTIGFVLQNPTDQLFGATVEDDVAFGPRNLGLGEAEVQKRVEEALATVDAAHLRRRPIHQLSFGEQKRIAIAGVLAMRPRILLLDEPTAGLDPLAEEQMMTLLHELNGQQGITMVLATHSVDLLPLVANRVCILQGGRVLDQGPLDRVLRDVALLQKARLRLPHVARLFYDAQQLEGIPVGDLPLTVADARKRLGELIHGAQAQAVQAKAAQADAAQAKAAQADAVQARKRSPEGSP